MIDLGKTPDEKERFIQIAMICLSVGILTADVFLPLGFVIWILYLIPLLISVWLSYRYAPFVTAWLITGAILGGSLISAMVRKDPSDLPNRAVFILMIAIVALLVWEIRSNYSHLEIEVNERRKSQAELEDLTRSLEERIIKRTHELSDVNRDLTEDIEKRHKVELSLETANKKLSLLAQITRHDISNRIFALLTEIDRAKDLSSDPLLRESLEHLEHTSMAIQDEIAFTKDYQDIGVQAPAWHRLTPLIRVAADQMNSPLVTITMDCEEVEIFADALMGKVFYNLIHNALRHGGRVTRITFSCTPSNEGLIISCKDDGIGIAPEDKERIFKKGFGKDSGLGLFLIREILAITSITIRETGEPGKGAQFEILMPMGMYRRPQDHE
ncbi:MAG: sensor histidine kinase [Methanoregula sp.]|nr:sensor histidine kinase [Methanoregula sp.]